LSRIERTREFDYEPFSQEGLAIAHAIKMELPDWTVVYFDEAAYHKRAGHVNRLREPYEYEVR
jgi:hypothetical protein